jgi:hypothetical protein
MATEKWVAGSGVGLTWTDAFSTATLNSIASGNAILSDVAIANGGTTLDMFADLSVALASAAFAAPNFLGIYLYPLNKDGSTYGDGRFGTSAAGPPGGIYTVGSIPLVAATQAQVGAVTGILIPPGTFKFLIYNMGGIAFASSGNTCQYRTYNRQVA